ncbi:MAG: hypothetical protein BEU01_00610 [Marine Group III euryarchaeote CG-Epi4]|uniref:Metallo-beta-lactamase domain-containing protein n=1 Tax=Marine Group III euryarchaeote CG-Epi4 TaxID=1888998 RepID=A0A1J5TJK0_9ARCH|nr:MAG: hypothetical protein BEU01_00610 [Marine Group III euryarchaeote CG-Epi4]
MTIDINRHNSKLFWFDLQPNEEREFITIYIIVDEKITLIETGPACSHKNLVEGINKAGFTLSDIDFIVPTHIHLDHFGGGGHIMEVCENAKAVVHPNAVYHVSNVNKWWSGSLDFLGDVAELYGEPLPIPEERIMSAEDGFELDLGVSMLNAMHTPGHAPHHITWIHNKSAFVGDSLGLWYPEIDKAFPVTPGYYRHDLALQSINSMSKLNLEEIFYTHFGPRPATGAFQQTLNEFQAWMSIVEDGINKSLNSEEILDILFLTQDGLKLTDIKHGIHQRNTHLGSVEGMMSCIKRKNEKS